MSNMEQGIIKKVELNELRARDTKARREVLENEIEILKLKVELAKLKNEQN